MISKLQLIKSSIISKHENEKGVVFIGAIALTIILALLGTVAVVTTSTEIIISKNHKTSVRAFYNTQAGVEEARTRLRGQPTGPNPNVNYAGDTADPSNPLWCAYIITSDSFQLSDDPDYDPTWTNYFPITGNPTNVGTVTNTIQTTPTDISYAVKIKHKREFDAEQAGHSVATPHYNDNDGSTATHTAASPGNIIYWGFGDPGSPATPVQFSTSAATTHKPVEIIEAIGSNASSTKTIEEEIVSNPGPPIYSTVYSKNDMTMNGAGSVDGSDKCGMQPPLIPIYSMSTIILNGGPNVVPGSPVSGGTTDIDIQTYIDMLRNGATVINTNNGSDITYWGDAGNYGVWYADTSILGSFTLTLNNMTGFGLLLVDGGTLNLGGGFKWHGLILSSGLINLNGGGGPNMINIEGTILGDQVEALNGFNIVEYDSCDIANALYTRPAIPISWQEIN